MIMKDILEKISEISEANKISKPFVVGGIPRSIYLGLDYDNSDIDITTNSSDITRLSLLTCDYFKEYFKVFDDGHISLYLEGYTLDFSSNFVSSDALEYVGDLEDDSLKEVYSRDFTMNTLHMDLKTYEIIDPTGAAKQDIDNKIIKTVVPPEIAMADDPNRLWRAINFASRLNFEISEDIVDFVLSNKEFFSDHPEIKTAYVEKIIGETVKINPTLTIENLLKMDILSLVPLSGEFKREIISRRMVKEYLDSI